MLKSVTREELAEASVNGDTSYTLWLRSADRREIREDNTPAFRYLTAYVRKAYRPATLSNLSTGLILGTGANGSLNSLFLNKSILERVRLFGMDPDPAAVKLCREKYASIGQPFQFGTFDIRKTPALPRKFHHVYLNRLMERVPNGMDLLNFAWETCERSLMVVLGEPMIRAEEDSLQFDTLTGKLTVRYNVGPFMDAIHALEGVHDPLVMTVYADNSQTREHLFLLRKDPTVSDFTDVFRFHGNSSGVFPWFRYGIQLA